MTYHIETRETPKWYWHAEARTWFESHDKATRFLDHAKAQAEMKYFGGSIKSKVVWTDTDDSVAYEDIKRWLDEALINLNTRTQELAEMRIWRDNALTASNETAEQLVGARHFLAVATAERDEAIDKNKVLASSLARTHYPETKESVEQRLTATLHDRYVMAALTGVIPVVSQLMSTVPSHIVDPSNLAQETLKLTVKSARRYADECIRQRNEATK